MNRGPICSAGMTQSHQLRGFSLMPSILRAGLFTLLSCLCIPFTAAQTFPSHATVGEIDLQINDPSGAALRASGTLTGPHTNRSFQTGATGAVSLGGLAFGAYRIQVFSQGFAVQILSIEVHSASPVSRQVTLS